MSTMHKEAKSAVLKRLSRIEGQVRGLCRMVVKMKNERKQNMKGNMKDIIWHRRT